MYPEVGGAPNPTVLDDDGVLPSVGLGAQALAKNARAGGVVGASGEVPSLIHWRGGQWVNPLSSH